MDDDTEYFDLEAVAEGSRPTNRQIALDQAIQFSGPEASRLAVLECAREFLAFLNGDDDAEPGTDG